MFDKGHYHIYEPAPIRPDDGELLREWIDHQPLHSSPGRVDGKAVPRTPLSRSCIESSNSDVMSCRGCRTAPTLDSM